MGLFDIFTSAGRLRRSLRIAVQLDGDIAEKRNAVEELATERLLQVDFTLEANVQSVLDFLDAALELKAELAGFVIAAIKRIEEQDSLQQSQAEQIENLKLTLLRKSCFVDIAEAEKTPLFEEIFSFFYPFDQIKSDDVDATLNFWTDLFAIKHQIPAEEIRTGLTNLSRFPYLKHEQELTLQALLFSFLQKNGRELAEDSQAEKTRRLKNLLPFLLQLAPVSAEIIDTLLFYLATFYEIFPRNWNDHNQLISQIGKATELSPAQQEKLSKFYADNIEQYRQSDDTDQARECGLAGYRNLLLSRRLHLGLLAKLVDAGDTAQDVLDALMFELKKGDAEVLLGALEKATACDLQTDRDRAEKILDICGAARKGGCERDWLLVNSCAALLVCGDEKSAEQLLKGIPTELASLSEFKFFQALLALRHGKFQAAAEMIAGVGALENFPIERLRLAVEAACFFLSPAQALQENDSEGLAGWHKAFAKSDWFDDYLNPDFDFIRGRILACSGNLHKADEFFCDRVAKSPSAQSLYYSALCLQWSGQWRKADDLLGKASAGDLALQSLKINALVREKKRRPQADVFSALPISTAPPALLLAKYHLVTGKTPCEIVDDETNRLYQEERLRILLGAALAKKDLKKADQCIAQLLFRSLPLAEQQYYEGVRALLAKDFKSALALLERSQSELTHHAGVFKALALAYKAKGDQRAAAAALLKATECNPYDAGIYAHLAQGYLKAGFHLELLALARTFPAQARWGKNDAYNLGRVIFQANKAIEEDRQIQQLAQAAIKVFERAGKYQDAKWYCWACKVLSRPTKKWHSEAVKLLAMRPDENDLRKPVPAQWLEALLTLETADLKGSFEAIETLIRLATEAKMSRGLHDIVTGSWQLAKTAIKEKKYTELAAVVRKIISLFPEEGAELQPLLTGLAVFVLMDSDADQENLGIDITDEQRRLAEAIRLLQEEKTTEAKELVEDLSDPDNAVVPSFSIIKAIHAAENGDEQTVRELSSKFEDEKSAKAWKILQLVTGVKAGSDQCHEGICNLIAENIEGRISAVDFSNSGMVAYLGVEGQKKSRQLVRDFLISLHARTLVEDEELAATYLRTAFVVDAEEHAVELIEKTQKLATCHCDDLSTIYTHFAAKALSNDDYSGASFWLTKEAELASTISNQCHDRIYTHFAAKALSNDDYSGATSWLTKEAELASTISNQCHDRTLIEDAEPTVTFQPTGVAAVVVDAKEDPLESLRERGLELIRKHADREVHRSGSQKKQNWRAR